MPFDPDLSLFPPLYFHMLPTISMGIDRPAGIELSGISAQSRLI